MVKRNPTVRRITSPKLIAALLALGFFAACARQNPFIGTWNGTSKQSFGRVNTTCTFTSAFVECKDTLDIGPGGAGAPYDQKTDTEAVSKLGDFNIQPDGSMTYNNTATTIVLHRVR